MKKFDFKTCKMNPQCIALLKEIQDIPISEEKFVEEWGKMRKYSSHPHPSKRYNKSNSRYLYQNLRDKFGFFQ